jgi:hypothetical protein
MRIKITHISAANMVKEASEAYIKYWQTAWEKEDTKRYREDLRISYQDGADLFCIGHLLEQNRVKEARDLANSLDTAVREEIPDAAWDFLHQ